MKPINIIERIERHANELRDGECWTTDYVPNPRSGYVDVGAEAPDRGKRRLHRGVWEAHNAEPIPEGMVILHTCDNPACMNPEHLVLGSQQENVEDMISKDRAWFQKLQQQAG